MDNKTFDVNIDAAAIISQYDAEKVTPVTTKKINFDTKNYLQARLLPNETSKTMTIRFLPFESDSATCFKKVHMHTVRVNKEVSASGWKTFVCPVTNTDEDGKPLGERCPFCETSKKARELKFTPGISEETKKKYSDIEFLNRPKDMWLARCIERGHEEDGVKFWLFSSSKRKDGVFDKLENLFNQRMEDDDYNIFDLNEGKDIILTLSRTSDGKTNIQVVDKSKPSPLSSSKEEGMQWINDDKKWQDVYTVKPYEFMSIIVEQGVPRYSKEIGGWYDALKGREDEAEAEKERAEEEAMQTTDYSRIAANGDGIIDGNAYSTR